VTLPLGIAIGGGVLLLLGLLALALSRRGRETGGTSPAADPQSELQPV
jgi:hypothetical protein